MRDLEKDISQVRVEIRSEEDDSIHTLLVLKSLERSLSFYEMRTFIRSRLKD